MKKLAISPSHLAAAKNQAYSVRDNLQDDHHASIYFPKNEFLNLWASCLGFPSWGDLNATTIHANKDSSNVIVLTEATVSALAEAIVDKSQNPYAHTTRVSFLLQQSMTSLELALYPQGILNEVEEANKPENQQPITLMLGYAKYAGFVADYLINNGRPINLVKANAAAVLLEHAKKQRKIKNVNRKTAGELYLDIYPNSGKSVDYVIDQAISEGAIEVVTNFDNSQPAETINLTSIALQWFSLKYTDDYSPEWFKWKRVFDKEWMNSSLQKSSYSNLKIMKHFFDKISPIDVLHKYTFPAIELRSKPNPSDYSSTREYSQYYFDMIEYEWPLAIEHQTGKKVNDSHFFYFNPVLYLANFPNKLSNIKLISFNAITNENKMMSIPDLVLSKPFPNKNWIVAGGKDNTLFGFYAEIPSNTKSIKTQTIWELCHEDKKYTINHTIDIDLIFVVGNTIFSTRNVSDFNSTDPTALLKKKSFTVESFLGTKHITGSASNNAECQSIPRVSNPGFSCSMEEGVFRISERIALGSSVACKSTYALGH
jgi:hypothetical protein